ncbi:MAG: hypothetical protein ACKVW3_14035 [Phycisphaerales bacterium]
MTRRDTDPQAAAREEGPTGSGTTVAERKRRYFNDRDAPCPVCDYNLRSSPGENCPECGARIPWPFREPISNVAWAVGLAGMALTYLFGLGLATAGLGGSFVVGCMALLGLLGARSTARHYIRTRRAFGRLPRHVKQMHVAGWWLAALAVGVVCVLVWRSIWGRAR